MNAEEKKKKALWVGSKGALHEFNFVMDSDGVFEVDTNSLWSVILENVYVFFWYCESDESAKGELKVCFS